MPNIKDILQKAPATNISSVPKYAIFKAGLSSLSDGWTKYKEKVPDMLDSNQNVETTCNFKLKLTKLKDPFMKRVQKN